MIDSHYQTAVYEHLKNRAGNSAVVSVAGSGKTTTALNGIGHIPKFYSVLLGAFNKDIQVDFEKKGREKGYTHVKYTTYNGFGWGICLKRMRIKPQLDVDKTVHILGNIMNPLTQKEEKKYDRYCYIIKRMVMLFKALNIHSVEEAAKQYDTIIEHFGIEPPSDNDFFDILMQCFKQCIETLSVFDFDDQKYMPVHLGLEIPKYDQVLLDEFQDTCPLELELMTQAAAGGQFCGLGDPDQAIYGFKGATPDAFGKYIKDFSAKELSLSICYRCPISVVKEAQRIVPRIEWADEAAEGSVDTIKFSEYDINVREGDYVLCRTTAPLIKRCLQKIQQKRNAKVRGRDIGNGIIGLIERVSDGNSTLNIEYLLTCLNDYKIKRIEILRKLHKESEIVKVQDQVDSVEVIAEGCSSSGDVIKRTNSIFCDDKDRHTGIDFLSVHKSKGLQNKKVWLLRPDLLPHPNAKKEWMIAEEARLKYVAITRSENQFRYVLKENDEK